MMTNRQQAGLLLSRQLVKAITKNVLLNGSHTLVIALPRGGVLVAAEVALTLGCPLDILASKKIGAPGQPEFAIGAVTSDGTVVLDEPMAKYLQVPHFYLQAHQQQLIDKTREMEQSWRSAAGIFQPLDITNHRVIVVDDGVATGMTAMAAARSLRNRGTAELIFAAPVISCEALRLLEIEYDRVIALDVPSDFQSVGQFYDDFHQVTDDEVASALRKASHERSAGSKISSTNSNTV